MKKPYIIFSIVSACLCVSLWIVAVVLELLDLQIAMGICIFTGLFFLLAASAPFLQFVIPHATRGEIANALAEYDFTLKKQPRTEYYDLGKDGVDAVFFWLGEREDLGDGEYENERAVGEEITFTEKGMFLAGVNFPYNEFEVRFREERLGRRVILRLVIHTITHEEVWLPFNGETASLLAAYPFVVRDTDKMQYVLNERENAFRQILKYGRLKRIGNERD